MAKELLHENRGKIIGAFILALFMTAVWLGAQALLKELTERNGQSIRSELSALTYTKDAASAELDRLLPLTDLAPVSVQVHGQLYKALAEISYMTGDEMLYNRYMAYAMYYLKAMDDGVSCAYLTNKYIGRLYANGCYSAAEEMLLDLAADTQISALPLALQAAYYLSRADIAHMLGNDPSELLSLGRAAISLMPDGGERRLNQAKADILAARSLIDSGRFAEAQRLMKPYSQNDDFGLGCNQVYVVCDFKIPYYELRAKLALWERDAAAAEDYVNRYVQYCREFNFRAMELGLVQYMADQARLDGASYANGYLELEKRVTQRNLEDMTGRYSQFLLADMDAKIREVSQLEQGHTRLRRYLFLAALGGYGAAVLFCLVNVVISYMNKDGLTRLSSRRQYEKMRIRCERGKIPYCLIMLDIDNFKHVNDQFGHERGDQVLRAISGVLRGYSGRGVFSYRYGGEELCVMLLRVPEKRSREIAQEIRKTVADTAGDENMPITVSMGVACSERGEDIFREADMKLYEAKKSGKNRVC